MSVDRLRPIDSSRVGSRVCNRLNQEGRIGRVENVGGSILSNRIGEVVESGKLSQWSPANPFTPKEES